MSRHVFGSQNIQCLFTIFLNTCSNTLTFDWRNEVQNTNTSYHQYYQDYNLTSIPWTKVRVCKFHSHVIWTRVLSVGKQNKNRGSNFGVCFIYMYIYVLVACMIQVFRMISVSFNLMNIDKASNVYYSKSTKIDHM